MGSDRSELNMSPTYRILGVSAVASVVLQRYAPQYSLGLIGTFIFLLLTIFIARQLWYVTIYPAFLSPLRHLPTAPDGQFILGHTREVLSADSGMPMRKWSETVPNDGLIKYSMWGSDRLLLTNPKVLGEVLVTKNYDFVKPYHFRSALGRILGVGLLLAEGDEHKLQRKNLMPAFAFRHIKELYPVFWDKSREMVECLSVASKSSERTIEKLDPKKPLDPERGQTEHAPGVIEVGNWTSRATLDIIGLAGMDHDFNALKDPNNKLSQTYRNLFNPSKSARYLQVAGIFLPFWFLRRIPIDRNNELDTAANFVKSVCRDIISAKRQLLSEKKERTHVDIVSVALDSGGFTDEELVNQMMTFLIAGHETTATAMIWGVYLLCKHPEKQQKLREAIRASLPSLNDTVTAADIDGCAYLHATCQEILRLWSPVSMTIRIAAHDTSINDVVVPKDTTVILAPWAVNTSANLWGPDSLEFKPERWLDADGRANNKGGADSNFSFLTFLHGPRGCIGQKFAQAEFECLIGAWFGRYETRFEEGSPLKEDGDVKVKGGITMKPKAGLWVELKELEGW